MTLASLSVILPAFNEARNLPTMVARLSDALRQLGLNYEIIVVNDGSTDETDTVCQRLAKIEKNLRLVSHERNRGYGSALRTGFANAHNDFVYVTDADGQFDLAHLSEFLDHTSAADAVIGYRAARSDAKHRVVLSRIGNWMARKQFGLTARDLNCAAKLLRRSRLASLRLTSTGAMISTELLYRAQQDRWRMLELPVSHFPRKLGHSTGARPGVLCRTIREFVSLVSAEAQRLPRRDPILTPSATPSPD